MGRCQRAALAKFTFKKSGLNLSLFKERPHALGRFTEDNSGTLQITDDAN